MADGEEKAGGKKTHDPVFPVHQLPEGGVQGGAGPDGIQSRQHGKGLGQAVQRAGRLSGPPQRRAVVGESPQVAIPSKHASAARGIPQQRCGTGGPALVAAPVGHRGEMVQCQG